MKGDAAAGQGIAGTLACSQSRVLELLIWGSQRRFHLAGPAAAGYGLT
jgi:hypothetical protein